jgi:type IV secretory pathway TraG/TraD family ATPase VirD4
LDEARKLGRLEGLADVMSNGRSKGAAVLLGFQDIDGLIAVYGKEVAYELTSLCNTFGVLKLNGITSPKWASELFSDTEVREPTQSAGTTTGGERTTNTFTVSEQIRTKPLYMASQFRTLPLPSKELGYLAGYFCSAQFGSVPYRAEIPWNELMARICKRSETEPDFVRWPSESAKNLLPWQDADYKRLGISIGDPTPQSEAERDSTADAQETAGDDGNRVEDEDDSTSGGFTDPFAQS